MSTLVASWPTYLLRDVPENLRSRLALDAAADDSSVSDVIRQILCARYKLDCRPTPYRYVERPAIRPTVLLRLQPDLKGELFLESERTGKPVRRIIIETLVDYYTIDLLRYYNGKDHP